MIAKYRKKFPFISHNMTETRIYRIWCVMKSRCNNPNAAGYKNYGGRGVKVCDRWNNSFENFYEDMKEGYADDLFIEREDNDADYCKNNCRWATRAEQARNKRNNFWFEANGIKMIKMDWAKRWGVCHTTINSRLKQGISFQQLYDDYENRQN